jgi:hypothetical protein
MMCFQISLLSDLNLFIYVYYDIYSPGLTYFVMFYIQNKSYHILQLM